MAVRDKESVEESAKAAGVLVVMTVRVVVTLPVVVTVPMVMPMPMLMFVRVRVVMPMRGLLDLVGRSSCADDPGVLVCVLHAAPLSLGVWWWRGVPPRVCSAWKIASATSWRACSFSSR